MTTLGRHLTAQDKRDLLRVYGRRYGLRTLVETGLYRGYGSGMSLGDAFDRYVVIDCQPRNVQVARAVGFDARLGDSARLLPAVLNELGGPALFWLDAHGVRSDFPGFPAFPTMNELRAIAFWRHGPNSVVLVDDLGMFGAESWQPLIGAPELDELRRFVDTLGVWERTERDETMRLTPKSRPPSGVEPAEGSPPGALQEATATDKPSIEKLVEQVRANYTRVCKCEWDDYGASSRMTTNDECVIHGDMTDPLDELIAESGMVR